MIEQKIIYKFVPNETDNQPEDCLISAVHLVEEMRYAQPEEKAAVLAAIAMAQAMRNIAHVLENIQKIMETPNHG